MYSSIGGSRNPLMAIGPNRCLNAALTTTLHWDPKLPPIQDPGFIFGLQTKTHKGGFIFFFGEYRYKVRKHNYY